MILTPQEVQVEVDTLVKYAGFSEQEARDEVAEWMSQEGYEVA